MREDYYQLLDVGERATQDEIKAAYRRQAMKFHPDRNPDNAAAEERFVLIAEAYRTLGDADARYQYDGWLEKQRRYSSAPELAAMPRHTRISARHGYARREERRRRREERSRLRVGADPRPPHGALAHGGGPRRNERRELARAGTREGDADTVEERALEHLGDTRFHVVDADRRGGVGEHREGVAHRISVSQ